MLKRFLLIVSLVLVIVILAPTSVTAQDDAWAILIMDASTGDLYRVTPTAIQPALTVSTSTPLYRVNEAQLSPDGSKVLFQAALDQNYSTVGVYLADLQTSTCCQPLAFPGSAELNFAMLAGFSPDGTQMAVSFGKQGDPAIGMEPRLVVFDVASGTVQAELVASRVVDANNTFPPGVIAVGGWTPQGIEVTPGCVGCEGVWSGDYRLWDPATDALSAPSVPFDIFWTPMPGDGPLMNATANAAYPGSGIPQAFFAPANVVELRDTLDAPSQVVYFNTQALYIGRAAWVLDGQGILVGMGGDLYYDEFNNVASQEGDSMLVLRGGQQVPIEGEVAARVIAATSDGWLSSTYNDPTITHYAYDLASGQLSIQTLGNIPNGLVVGRLTPHTPPTGTFSTISPPQAVTCPGSLPSRLFPGQIAKVTSGPPNNFRDGPSLSATDIGDLPGDAWFIVMDGPVCADDMAWWQVNYEGQIGWTSEGSGDTYWLEPIPQ